MKPKISIVIPVYNEGETIITCLKAIEQLATAPYEVIVVDNNSTDGSIKQLESFPWVKLVSELRQGVIHARKAGFDLAQGEIIARIDADTILPVGWIDQVAKIMTDNPNLTAVSGSCNYYDFLFANLVNNIDHFFRLYMHRRLKKRTFLFGSNMALRKSSWDQVKPSLCSVGSIHEDMDLAIHLQELGYEVGYIKELVAGTSFRRIESGFLGFIKYSLISPRTYARHNILQRFYMYPVIIFCWLVYGPAHFIYLFYSPEDHSYSLKNFLIRDLHQMRVDPTTNVV